MLTGKRVLLRPMRDADIATQHTFDQDLELYGLDSAVPQVSPWSARMPSTPRAPHSTRRSRHSRLRPMGTTLDIARCATSTIAMATSNLGLRLGIAPTGGVDMGAK